MSLLRCDMIVNEATLQDQIVTEWPSTMRNSIQHSNL